MFYFATGVVGWVLVYVFIPETKGRSYLELDELFERRISVRMSASTETAVDVAKKEGEPRGQVYLRGRVWSGCPMGRDCRATERCMYCKYSLRFCFEDGATSSRGTPSGGDKSSDMAVDCEPTTAPISGGIEPRGWHEERRWPIGIPPDAAPRRGQLCLPVARDAMAAKMEDDSSSRAPRALSATQLARVSSV